MPGNSGNPVVLIDVDGVLSVYGQGLDTSPGQGRWTSVDGIPHFLSESAAEPLRRLAAGFRCVWCTGWEDRADEHLRRHYALERTFPHLVFPRAPAGAHWKLGAIDEAFGPDQALAWIDDTLDASCRAWARGRPGPTLLVPTDPAIGLQDDHADRIEHWASGLGSLRAMRTR